MGEDTKVEQTPDEALEVDQATDTEISELQSKVDQYQTDLDVVDKETDEALRQVKAEAILSNVETTKRRLMLKLMS